MTDSVLASHSKLDSTACTWYEYRARQHIDLDYTNSNTMQTGAGTCASKLGQADLGFATLNDMRENAEMIANLSPHTPLIADADTGYGGNSTYT
jgi:isocitrate lyase